ncbi:hypothetical protein EXIGLDRAFT_703994 [Exidia glandulosa HHB12029]|uniref:Uncharacterized protein n=1 Tax=Exidia glandulosa HHB12029 TaxID=1314781 RepID=A0A165L0E8_EXIGL|nr:hypothetical protein EXIGLDRAFT_703994 [Exidia glandulosa HHB12029]
MPSRMTDCDADADEEEDLDPMEEEVHAEEAKEKKELENEKTSVCVKLARYSEGTAATATLVTSPTRLTRSQSARLAADKVRVTRSMASGIAAASSLRPSASTPAVERLGCCASQTSDIAPVVTPSNSGPNYSDEEDEECDWSMVAEAGTVKRDLSVEDRAALLEEREVDELDVTGREPSWFVPASEADEYDDMGAVLATSSMCPQSAVMRKLRDKEEDLESSPATITKADKTSYTVCSDESEEAELVSDFLLHDLRARRAQSVAGWLSSVMYTTEE